ncbi:MAG: aldehyde dehydrogenase family protein [Sporocytophaga sp.]|uniref:aldehyde dehydrogenase family protein n=1 Tax=Sporocytophaga sp. TaxID=2231183 RepID=UPI001B2A8B0B|nr:aldehyde dehydrogenase family protein [Sporocytophaga sp.]MBO9701433.1 aldehyde dehydrogenase family protein [Sporocytophaga sp.]
MDSSLKQIFEHQRIFFNEHLRYQEIRFRKQKLKNIRKWILNNQKLIREALYEDLRKPEPEADFGDIKPVLWEIDHTLEKLDDWVKERRVENITAMYGVKPSVVFEPMGVVLIIAPWNFPFNLSIGPLVSAIAAGNCVVLKPSEYSGATTKIIIKMIESLFSEKEVKVVSGEADVAEELLNLPFNHIFFTGSTEVGKKVMKAAAENLSSVTLELGGCNPLIIDDSANLKDAAQKVLFGKFVNAGQSCLSVNTIFIDYKVKEKFEKILLEHFYKFYPDFKSGKMKDLASIINQKHVDRLCKMIDTSIASGAINLLDKIPPQENFVPPAILTNVSLDATILKTEVFGPVLPIVGYKKISEVINFIRTNHKPLALYIFSKDQDTVDYISQSLSSGAICINDTTLHFVHPYLPFGGVNYSGIGRSHGYSGFKAFSNERAVLKQRVGFTGVKLIYPPYSKKVKFFIRFIMRFL